MSFSIQQSINSAVRKDRKLKSPAHWSPSKLGSCLRGVYFERLGRTPDTDFTDRELRVFHIGKMFEDWVMGLITSQVKHETQPRLEWKEYDVAGYADLVVEQDGQKIVYEIKSKNSKAFWYMDKKGEGANEQHKMQLWVYLKCLNIPEGRILYLEKDTLTTLEYPVYLNDTELEEKITNELKILNKAWATKTPPPMAKTGWQASYCRWHKQCEEHESNLSVPQ